MPRAMYARPGRRLVFTGAAGLLSCGLISCTMVGCKHAAEETPSVAVSVRAEHPETGPISEEIAADAILAPLAQAALTPKISAPVREFYVERGGHVRKGQLLVTLEARDLAGGALDSQGGLSSAEAAYQMAVHATIPEEDQKAQLEVDQARANLVVARRTAEERKRLLDEGAIAGREADTAAAAEVEAQGAYDMAVKHLASVGDTTRAANTRAAQGQLTSAKGRYQTAQAQVGYSSLRSPIDGVVTDRPLFAGETATAGAPILTVMDTSSLLAKLHLAQSSAQKLKVGSAAEVQVAGMEQPVAAKVSFISPALDPGSTTVEVWLKLLNADQSLRVGTPVHVVITGRTIPNALLIPTSALLPSQDSRYVIMIAGADGLAHRRAVTLGIRTTGKVQVTDGLSVNENVIVEGAYGLDDGTGISLARDPSEQTEPGTAGTARPGSNN